MLKLKKALSSAFFIACFSVSAASAQCLPQGSAQPVEVSKVVDGDTVRLDSGRSVRLLGVNTPELNIGKGRPEPFALEAKTALQGLVTNNATQIVLGVEPEDRYKRLLAYLIVGERSASEYLVSRGLGWAVAVEPNTDLAECLFQAESAARLAKRGVWSAEVVAAADITSGGFNVIQGRVSRVDVTSKQIYVELDDHVALRLERAELNRQLEGFLTNSVGRLLEARGWIVDRRKQLKSGSRYKPFLLPITSRWHLNLAP